MLGSTLSADGLWCNWTYGGNEPWCVLYGTMPVDLNVQRSIQASPDVGAIHGVKQDEWISDDQYGYFWSGPGLNKRRKVLRSIKYAGCWKLRWESYTRCKKKHGICKLDSKSAHR